MDKLLERLKDIEDPEARSAYADAATNAFLTAQMKELREARGMTQEELAEEIGTQQSGISRWQNTGYANCKIGTLRKFARAYGVRLRITFEEFGTLPQDIGGFTKKRLVPRKFEDDPAFNPQALRRRYRQRGVKRRGSKRTSALQSVPRKPIEKARLGFASDQEVAAANGSGNNSTSDYMPPVGGANNSVGPIGNRVMYGRS